MRAVKLYDAQLVQSLNRSLGPTLVAFAADMRDRQKPAQAAVGTQRLDLSERQRLELVYDLFNDVAKAQHSQDLARAWFIGANCGVAGTKQVSPAEAIRHGQFEDARRSAQRMLDPEEMGS